MTNKSLTPISIIKSWESAHIDSPDRVNMLSENDFYAFSSPVKDSFLNWVWCQNPSSTNVKKIYDFFQGKPHIYYLDEANSHITHQAISSGLLPVESFPQFLFDLEETAILESPNKNLEFNKVISISDLEEWSRTFCDGYEAYDYQYIMKFLIPFFHSKLAPTLFTGSFNGEKICTGMLYQNDHIFSIMGIATKTKYRKQGFASSISNHLLQHAKTQGGKKVVLNATPIAINMYKKIGFKHYISEKVFLPRAFL